MPYVYYKCVIMLQYKNTKNKNIIILLFLLSLIIDYDLWWPIVDSLQIQQLLRTSNIIKIIILLTIIIYIF